MTGTVLLSTGSGDLCCVDAADRDVWRIGFAPEPWAWTPWEYADGGRFNGRWDDPDGIWRTLYVGASRLVCFLEVLAPFRPDPALAAEMDAIDEDQEDTATHPMIASARLPRSWCGPRRLGSGRLAGWFVAPGHTESLPTLRARFLRLARHLGLPDVDAAAIRAAEPRAFTQAVAAWLHDLDWPDGQPVAGIQFESRHGDDLTLWANFERSPDEPVSSKLHDLTDAPLDADDPDLVEAMRIHRLDWS
ncbi:hypothetical protein N864_22195 [Intrasporangium chromatireducens Q5-1]|uniref:RES domain-containing protein n=1 Tax=Intrasporangium chromatireducens Q5-1 TaxID=584657 RepID=W9GJR0_9MICO|nr:RES domain-containing protein [Intrasporangium chromatireducens]EWT06340.1 hypothetical protein N864_22195 [Intrasporangium chromatireducens Q5-1]